MSNLFLHRSLDCLPLSLHHFRVQRVLNAVTRYVAELRPRDHVTL